MGYKLLHGCQHVFALRVAYVVAAMVRALAEFEYQEREPGLVVWLFHACTSPRHCHSIRISRPHCAHVVSSRAVMIFAPQFEHVVT
jgi:hypothetical protein